jgi:hypothetical protein
VTDRPAGDSWRLHKMGKLMQRFSKAAKSPFEEPSQLPAQQQGHGCGPEDGLWRRTSLEDSANMSHGDKGAADR